MLNYIETKALPINEDTLNIAVACLPDGFIGIPTHLVLNGNWLIINDLQTKFSKQSVGAIDKNVKISNCWISDADFHTGWQITDEPDTYGFVTVQRIV